MVAIFDLPLTRAWLKTYFLETETRPRRYRDVGYPSQDPLETKTWRPRHLMLNYNSSLVVNHLLQRLCLVPKGLVYAAMLWKIICD